MVLDLLDQCTMFHGQLITYKNLANPIKHNQIFDAILFYSPSGIKSVMKNNLLNDSYWICIGKTTSNYAKKYSDKVLSCNVPTIENVIHKTIKLFNND